MLHKDKIYHHTSKSPLIISFSTFISPWWWVGLWYILKKRKTFDTIKTFGSIALYVFCVSSFSVFLWIIVLWKKLFQWSIWFRSISFTWIKKACCWNSWTNSCYFHSVLHTYKLVIWNQLYTNTKEESKKKRILLVFHFVNLVKG